MRLVSMMLFSKAMREGSDSGENIAAFDADRASGRSHSEK